MATSTTTKVEKIVDLYRKLSIIPALTGAKLNRCENVLTTWWSHRNVEKGKTTKFCKNFVLNELGKVAECMPHDVSNECMSSTSPTETFRAVVRESDEKQFLEIWKKQNLYRTVDLKALDIHGSVYSDVEFGCLEWSPDESKVLYLAEKKVKSEPFYKRKAKKEDATGDAPPTQGEEYLFRQDWGEQFVGKKSSVIVQYDIETDIANILEGIPDNITPAKTVYSPDGKSIVGIAYETEPRKFGLIYCTNRTSSIFKLSLSGEYELMPLVDKSVKSPIFTPGGKYLIWLQRQHKGPHAATMALVKCEWPFSSASVPKIVVDIVPKEVEIKNGKVFHGLYNSGFPKRCWGSGNRLILSTQQKCCVKTYVIDIDSGDVTELENENGTTVVLDVTNDLLVTCLRNYLTPDVLCIGKLPPKGAEASIKWIKLTEGKVPDSLQNCTITNLHLKQPECAKVVEFTATYIGPKSCDKKVPLIVWPHGGPHSAFPNNFMLELAVLLSMDYAILLVNYRGSVGAGENNVRYLLGKIGKVDVADCVFATNAALEKFSWLDSEKVALNGGSHGGFLVTHLSGQYPDMYKAVVARNPVIDVASMSTISDIPDWCYVEGGSEYTQKGPINDDLFLELRKASPIEHAHKVKAPTLLQIGSKDLRVPPEQGIEFYHRLKANGATVSMNLYEDNHPLGTVPNEFDNVINSVLWYEKYLKA